jgi:hypothetical protein
VSIAWSRNADNGKMKKLNREGTEAKRRVTENVYPTQDV